MDMDFLSGLKEKATDLAQTGVAKSRQLMEIAKLKTANISEEETIKKAYIELGKLYYAEKGAAPDAAYTAACQRITQAKENIQANNDRLAEIKAADQSAPATAEVEVTIEAEQMAAEEPVTPAEPAEEPAAPVEPAEEPAAPAGTVGSEEPKSEE